jgi:8-oxo-dGTP pyrophosphatase MutT (NUDIX family)
MRIEIVPIPAAFDRYSSPEELLAACQDTPIKGYPSPQERWHVSAEEWDAMAVTGVITVPNGPWRVADYPRDAPPGVVLDSADPRNIPQAQKDAWRAEYQLVTDEGLPVHPKAKLGVTSRAQDEKTGLVHRLGMATGIGRERRHGASKTGALLLARLGLNGTIEYPVVTEMRNGRQRRSFPGGYVEPDESVAAASVRESEEEAGVVSGCEAAAVPWNAVEALPQVLWQLSPSVTGPCTLNAWLAEHFRAIDATTVPDMQAVNLKADLREVKAAEWVPADVLIADKTLLGAHRRALRAHIALIRGQRQRQ